ncbi:hypothetical protein JCM8547_001159 [Rhodosporidiobolus lusitaniae]
MAATAVLLAQAAAFPQPSSSRVKQRSTSRPSHHSSSSERPAHTRRPSATASSPLVCPGALSASTSTLICPVTGFSSPAPVEPAELTAAERVRQAELRKRTDDEISKGLLVHSAADASTTETTTLYLPPLLSLLPSNLAHRTPSPVFALDGNGTTSPAAPAAVQYTLTRLPSIDPFSLALHRALHFFRPITPLYAVAPYSESFNWSEFELRGETEEDDKELLEGEFEAYCVAFRSRRRRDLEEGEARELYEKDRAAHEEAVSHGGLISYWFGSPMPLIRERSSSSSSATSSTSPSFTSSPSALDPHDLSGRNLATCIWTSRAHALAAMKGPKHIEAARLAKRTYESFTLERYVLRKEKGARGVRVLDWEA